MKKDKKCLNSENAVNDLLAYVNNHLGLGIEQEERLYSQLEVLVLKKKKMVAQKGEIYSDSFWLQCGYGRFFKLVTNCEGITEEVTIDFFRPGKIMFVKEVFSNESAKEFHFELASGAVIIPLSEGCSNALHLTELEAAKLSAKVMALDRSESLRRMNFLQLNPRERYTKFLKYFGVGIEQYFLVKQIACVLKMRPSYLSRLRGELLRKGTEALMYLQTVFFISEFV